MGSNYSMNNKNAEEGNNNGNHHNENKGIGETLSSSHMKNETSHVDDMEEEDNDDIGGYQFSTAPLYQTKPNMTTTTSIFETTNFHTAPLFRTSVIDYQSTTLEDISERRPVSLSIKDVEDQDFFSRASLLSRPHSTSKIGPFPSMAAPSSEPISHPIRSLVGQPSPQRRIQTEEPSLSQSTQRPSSTNPAVQDYLDSPFKLLQLAKTKLNQDNDVLYTKFERLLKEIERLTANRLEKDSFEHFSNQLLKDETLKLSQEKEQLKVFIVKGFIWAALLRQHIVNQRITLPSLAELHDLKCLNEDQGNCNHEQDSIDYVRGFVRAMKALLNLGVPPLPNKTVFIIACGLLEGSDKIHISSQSIKAVILREKIFSELTGIVKQKRQPKTIKNETDIVELPLTQSPPSIAVPRSGDKRIYDEEDSLLSQTSVTKSQCSSSNKAKKFKRETDIPIFGRITSMDNVCSQNSAQVSPSIVNPTLQMTPTSSATDYFDNLDAFKRLAQSKLRDEQVTEILFRAIEDVKKRAPSRLNFAYMKKFRVRWELMKLPTASAPVLETRKLWFYAMMVRQYIVNCKLPLPTISSLPSEVASLVNGGITETNGEYLLGFVRVIMAMRDMGVPFELHEKYFLGVGGLLEGSGTRYIKANPVLPHIQCRLDIIRNLVGSNGVAETIPEVDEEEHDDHDNADDVEVSQKEEISRSKEMVPPLVQPFGGHPSMNPVVDPFSFINKSQELETFKVPTILPAGELKLEIAGTIGGVVETLRRCKLQLNNVPDSSRDSLHEIYLELKKIYEASQGMEAKLSVKN